MCRLRLGVIFALFALIIVTAVTQGQGRASAGERIAIHALPVALSVMYADWPHDYTANGPLAAQVHELVPTVGVTETIRRIRAQNFAQDDAPYYWYADDRGMGDYVILAFRIFGANNYALFFFYFLILGTSIVLFLLAYGRSQQAGLMIALGLVAFFVCIPLWQLTYLTAKASINISESRMFSILAAVSILHFCWLAFAAPKSLSKTEWFCALGQLAIYAFLLHCRSSLRVETVALTCCMLVALIWQLVRSREASWHPKRLTLAAAFPILAAVVIVPAYQHSAFNPGYFADKGARTFWHNIVIGFAHNDYFKSLLTLDGSDRLAAVAVLRHAKIKQPTIDPEASATQAMLSLGGDGTYDWANYERQARQLVIDTVKTHPTEFARMMLWEKPQLVLSYFGYLLDPKNFLAKYSYPWQHGRKVLTFFAFSLLLITFVAAAFKPRRQDFAAIKPILVVATAIAGCLFAVPVVFYPMITTIAGPFFYACFIFFMLLIFVWSPLTQRAMSRMQRLSSRHSP